MQICLLDSAGTASSCTAARAAEVGAALGFRGGLISEAGEATAGVETGDVDSDPGSGSATLAPMQVGPVGPAARRTRYEHLAPLHAELAALPEGDADRERLRTVLIAGYLPVARNIARRYGYRGAEVDDLEQVASMGLVLAVDRFEPGRGFDFLSFAVPTSCHLQSASASGAWVDRSRLRRRTRVEVPHLDQQAFVGVADVECASGAGVVDDVRDELADDQFCVVAHPVVDPPREAGGPDQRAPRRVSRAAGPVPAAGSPVPNRCHALLSATRRAPAEP